MSWRILDFYGVPVLWESIVFVLVCGKGSGGGVFVEWSGGMNVKERMSVRVEEC